MNFRENAMAVLHYEPFEKLPVVSFGYWGETVQKWAEEGHITREEADDYCRYGDNGAGDNAIMRKLGFDFNWNSCVGMQTDLFPHFELKTLEERPDGSRIIRDENGLITLVKPGVVSIPAEIGTTLTDREVWERDYLPRLQFSMERVPLDLAEKLRSDEGRELPIGLHCGSLMGRVRDLLGVEQMSYLTVDDPDLLEEIVDTMDTLCYDCVKAMLETGAKFDYAHFWEDICFKNGPLVVPSFFEETVGPHYKRITDLLLSYGVDVVSVDCDGWIDRLVPIWLENGVNTMFPIEVGTFIPCPDHRIAPDAKFENVQYYCDKLQNLKL